MTLQEHCKSLSEGDRFDLAIRLCEKAIPIWDSFTTHNELVYHETVIGLTHTVKADLLYRTIGYCRSKQIDHLKKDGGIENLLNEFVDPVAALQDDDWDLPIDVKKTFYAVYNLLDGILKPTTVFDEQTHYVSINKAVDAIYNSGLLNEERIRRIIYPSKQ